MSDAKQALERASAPRERKTIYELIERQAPAIEKALPAAIGAERFTRLVLTEVRRNPALLECSADSLLAAMMLTAQLGLEPGPLGLVYFVPFAKQVQWILGYKGMIELARRSDRMRDIVARTVHEGDEFDYEYGLRDKLRHRPAEPSERGGARCWYGIARYAPAGATLAVLYPADVEAHRKRSPAARRDSGPWTTDYDAMACKTVIRTMAPYLPLAPQLARAVEADGGFARGLDDDAQPVVEGEAEETNGDA